jgi:hypothetical protein
MSEKLDMALRACERHVLRTVCGSIKKNAQGESAIVIVIAEDTDVVIHIKFKSHGGPEHIRRMGKFDQQYRGKS